MTPKSVLLISAFSISRRCRAFFALVVMGSLMASLGCNIDPSAAPDMKARTPSPAAPRSVATVSIAPGNSAIAAGLRQQFTATVTNTNNTAVTWSAGEGTISSSGLYVAPVVVSQTTTTITATSVYDQSAKATAT